VLTKLNQVQIQVKPNSWIPIKVQHHPQNPIDFFLLQGFQLQNIYENSSLPSWVVMLPDRQTSKRTVSVSKNVPSLAALIKIRHDVVYRCVAVNLALLLTVLLTKTSLVSIICVYVCLLS